MIEMEIIKMLAKLCYPQCYVYQNDFFLDNIYKYTRNGYLYITQCLKV